MKHGNRGKCWSGKLNSSNTLKKKSRNLFFFVLLKSLRVRKDARERFADAEDGQDQEGKKMRSPRSTHRWIIEAGRVLEQEIISQRWSLPAVRKFSWTRQLQQLWSLLLLSVGQVFIKHRGEKAKRGRRSLQSGVRPLFVGIFFVVVARVSVHVGVLERAFKLSHISGVIRFSLEYWLMCWFSMSRRINMKVCLRCETSHLLCMSWQYDKHLTTPRGDFHLLYRLAQRANGNSWNCLKRLIEVH